MMSSREVLRRLKAEGWYEVGQDGSHVQLKHPTRPGKATVAHPRRDYKLKTIRSMERQTGVKLIEK